MSRAPPAAIRVEEQASRRATDVAKYFDPSATGRCRMRPIKGDQIGNVL